LLAFASFVLPVAGAQVLTESQLETIEYRNLGPFRVGAWVSDFAVPANGRDHLYTYYVALRSGGVWKTINNGTTFQPVFDGNGVQAIGDVTVAPSDNDIVWVGTGDNANARSSHAGLGVFKSEDGAATWRNMGLVDSHHIARIAIHPTDPDIVYVAAIGHLFSRNEERGLFRSTDGGETWEKVLFINDGVGVIDVVINPDSPDTLYAATYEMERKPWHFEAGGAESAIYKSTDGGVSWVRLEGGLPGGNIGRIGIDIYRNNPDILYAVFENLNLRAPTEDEAAADLEEGREPQQRTIGGEVYRSDDAGVTWSKTHDDATNVGGKAPYSFNQIIVDPNDDRKIFVTSVYLANSIDGGRTWRDLEEEGRVLFSENFGDVRAFWIDPQDSDRMLFGSDGGVYVTYDGGKTSDHLYNIAGGEFYAVGVDMADPYNIYGGLQDHESWKGPVNSWSGAVTLEDWLLVGLWDGMYNQVDPRDNRYLYTTAQFGGHRRVDQARGTREDIEPADPEKESAYRYPWTPAILISPHDHDVVYAGSQKVMRSDDRGDSWVEASPDLTHAKTVEEGGRCVDAGGAQGWINFCTVTSLDESELQAGVLWAGTDDGRVHVTRDGGASWQEVTAALAEAGAPEAFWVSRVRASYYDVATAYVAKSGFRFDEFEPQIYRTTDFGRSWQSIAANLPDSPVNVIVEDRNNRQLMFVGNDMGVYVTIDGGENWTALKGNMPVVPVKDLVIHPRESDLVAATYGRGLYVADISPLQEMNAALFEKEVHFFEIEDNIISGSTRADWGAYHMMGDRHLQTPNEPAGLAIRYYLRNEPRDVVELQIEDDNGNIVATPDATANAGLNLVHWDSSGVEDIEPGRFHVILQVNGASIRKEANLKPPIMFPIGPAALSPDQLR
jgi:photosystem II stability/assembly factor-like uncharacterized protein